MSYADGRDFAPEYARTMPDGTLVEIEKLGGGEIGKQYEGTWRYRVTPYGEKDETFFRQDFRTSTPKDHAEALVILVDFLYEGMEDETPDSDAAGNPLACVNYPHFLGALYDCPACEATGELGP